MTPGEDFDQTGFELPPAPRVAPAAIGQGELFADDYAQPDAADGEPVFRCSSCLRPPRGRSCFLCLRRPVFWTDGAIQGSPDDDFVQADAAESI